MGRSLPCLFSGMGVRPKCPALLPQHSLYQDLWFDGFWRQVFQCPAGRADDRDFLRVHQEMAWDEGSSDCGFPAWHKSMAYHDLSVESRIQSPALFSAFWYSMVILLLYLQACSPTYPFFSAFSCYSILCLWSIHCDYSHLFSALLWACRPGN